MDSEIVLVSLLIPLFVEVFLDQGRITNQNHNRASQIILPNLLKADFEIKNRQSCQAVESVDCQFSFSDSSILSAKQSKDY